MRRELFGIAMLLVMLTVTVSVSYWVIARLGKPKSQIQEKRESAELIRYYAVTEDQGPAFVLRSKDEIIKLITHAELPEYDANARILYGFRLTVRSPGGELAWSHNIYTRTRQSKDGERDGSYRYENTFGVNPGEQYGDDRLLEIRLPDTIPEGSLLELRLLGGSGEQALVRRALVRAYRQVQRSQVARKYRYLSLGSSQKRALAEQLAMPWDLVPEDTRLAMLSRRWDRMAAVGEDGIDYRTQLVFYTGFRLAPERDDEKYGVHVHALHQAAINVLVESPTELTLQAMRFDGESKRCSPQLDQQFTALGDGPATEPQEDITIDVDSVSTTTPIGERISVPGNGRGMTRILRVPAGLHTLRFRSESLIGAVFCLIADDRDDPQFGYIETIPLGTDLEQLVVDARRLPAYLSGFSERESPITTYVDGPQDLQARLFMFEVRVLMSGDRWLGPAPNLSYRFYDERGQELGTGTAELAPRFAPFEKVRLDINHGATTEARESPPRRRPDPRSATYEATLVRPVSEPLRFQVLAPENAFRLEVATDQPAALRVLSFLDERSRYELPYRDYIPEGLLWRYGPRELRPWFPTRPENREDLANTGRIARVRAQVRLQARELPESAEGTRQAVLIEPVRPPQRQLILEEVPEDRKAELRGQWPLGMYTLLDRPRRIAVRKRYGKRPRIRYLIEGDVAPLLGMKVRIAIQGQEPIIRTLATPRGIWNLPYLPEGAPLIECALLPSKGERADDEAMRSVADQLRCYIDRPPTNLMRATVMRARTVFSLSHRKLRLKVYKRAGQHLVVNAVVYSGWPGTRRGRVIHATIDGGRPKRSIGTLVSGLTQASRWWPLPAPRAKNPALFVDLAGRSPGYSRVVSIRLGDDISAGMHTITIEAPRLSAWVRFFTYDITRARQESAWQWKFEAP